MREPWLHTFDREGRPLAIDDVVVWREQLAEDFVVGVDGRERRVVTAFSASSPPHAVLEWGPEDPPLCWGTLLYVGDSMRVVKEYTGEPAALAWHDAVVAQVRAGVVR